MPDYTRNWDDSTPPGTRPAKEIDDAMRERWVDIHERMLTVFTTFGEDKTIPVDLKPAFKGNVVGAKLLFGPHGLQKLDSGTGTIQYNDENARAVTSVRGTFRIPVGCKITLFECWIDVFSSVTGLVELKVIDASTGGITSLSSVACTATTGIQLVASPALTHVMLNTEYLITRIASNGITLYNVYGFRLTVDYTDSTQK